MPRRRSRWWLALGGQTSIGPELPIRTNWKPSILRFCGANSEWQRTEPIWVTDRAVRHRALFFIVQHLALVIPSASIVHHMHQAYERLEVGSGEFGAFIAGPSKTADIEQSLVIGGHGPRSLTVYCLDSPG